MIVYNSVNACIIYIESKHYAYLALEGFIESEKIREFGNKVCKLCNEKQINRIIFDTSRLSVIKNSDIDWVINQIFPVMQNLEILKVAFLIPANPFGEVSVRNLLKNILKSEVGFYKTMEQAETWLFASQQNSVEKQTGFLN